MESTNSQHRNILQRIARRVMIERGLLPDFGPEVLQELSKIQVQIETKGGQIRDLTNLLWASIDNDDSRDLDQLTCAEPAPGDKTKVLVAVADVDSIVKDGSAIDQHARYNTTSVYTAAAIFPMLPENLSTNLTSLNFNEDRFSIVVEFLVAADGSTQDSDVYIARVRNRAKLAYNSVASWIDGTGSVPEPVKAVPGLDENLRVQDNVAQKMRNFRHEHGALSLETIEAKPVFDGDQLRDIQPEGTNRAKQIIEDFMIAANGATARYLASNKFSSIRRVVKTPKRWDRIVELAGEHGFTLPPDPDPKALDAFLGKQRSADPLRFPDLSLSVIKLMGSGEYVAEMPGDDAPGHFGLAVRDYTHSTAPNRRYPDLVTQRLLKAAILGLPQPYGNADLEKLATHCTQQEDSAKKVERQVTKSAAAMLLESRINEQFDAIVTGAGPKGTWVRLLNPPVEGKLARASEGVDVGHRIRVELTDVDVERGYIDFKRV